MFEHKTIIDSNGYVVEKCVLFKDEEPQLYRLKDGEKAVELFNKSEVVNNQTVLYLKPQWDGTKWVETATEEELNLDYPVVESEPTIEERLASTESMITTLMGV